MSKKLLCMLVSFGALTSFAWAQTGGSQVKPAEMPAATASSPTPLIPALPASRPKTPPSSDQERIAREARHDLVMLPHYSIWDFLTFRVVGNTIELYGDVKNPSVKRDAEDAVKDIEGVTKVVNNINVLPPFPSDDRIRRQVAHSIFSFGGLSRYSWSAVPSIHIIVGSGRVKLEGVVDNESDKNAAGLRANLVPGVFSVKNELLVAKQ